MCKIRVKSYKRFSKKLYYENAHFAQSDNLNRKGVVFMVIESRPICPFVGKECVACGVSQQSLRNGIIHPCMYFDELAPSDTEPCLLKRAVNKMLKIPDFPEVKPIEVPY